MTNLPDETIKPQPWLAVPRIHPIRLIVIHSTRGDVSQALQYTATKNWLLHPTNNGGGWGSSTNRIISHEGQMCVCWPDDMSPTYSAGFGHSSSDWAIDWYAISFELAQRSFSERFAEPTLVRTAREVALLCLKYDIPPVWLPHVNQAAGVPTGITGHENTDNGVKLGKTDPGTNLAAGGQFDTNDFIRRVREEIQRFSVPPPPPPDDGFRIHVIAPGENLFRIAMLHYDDGTRWTEIHEANRDLLGDDPHLVRVGMRLRIP